MKTIVSGPNRFQYVTRAEWGAGPLRRGNVVPAAQFVGVASHHTVMGAAGKGDPLAVAAYMRRLQVVRPDLGSEVPYSAVIFAGATPNEATIAEGRGKAVTGAHTAGHNSTLYGFAWAANTNLEPVTPGMVAAFRWLAADWLTDPAGARKTIGHYEVYATECPGASGKQVLSQLQPPFTKGGVLVASIRDRQVMLWNAGFVGPPHTLRSYATLAEWADGIDGPETQRAQAAYDARPDKVTVDRTTIAELERQAEALLGSIRELL